MIFENLIRHNPLEDSTYSKESHSSNARPLTQTHTHTVQREKPAWYDATNTGPDILHIVDTAIMEGQLYFSNRNTQQIQDTTDNHPACYQ